ncbi:hypothetical protein ACH5RR_034199 [Cinchona calisaya]|uniref:Phytocyanin domain-containing protein n=1 Tax=Cinchona calisaya TaxID=153742 RepID=A0ABD2YA57_9GENT
MASCYSTTKVACLFLVIIYGLAVASLADKIEYTVPWNKPVELLMFPAGKTFYPGDVLRFEYNPHTAAVYKVDIVGYNLCNIDQGTFLGDDGNTYYTIPTTGTFFFVSYPFQCLEGNALAIEVK